MNKLLLTLFLLTACTQNQPAPNNQIPQQLSDNQILITTQGMVCDFCASGLERLFGYHDAVNNVAIDFDTGSVLLNIHPNKIITDDAIKDVITGNGFDLVSIKRD